MKLDFVKIGNLVCPTLDQPGITRENQILIEDVLKCTVISEKEQDTVMTLTVRIKSQVVADFTGYTHPTEWRCVENLSECPAVITSACTHVGSQPRLCAKDRGRAAKWEPQE